MAGNVRRVKLAGIGTVTIRRHHWARNISIKVSEIGEVSVSAPPSTPLLFINNLLLKRKNWIDQQLQTYSKQPKILTHDMNIGKSHRLIFQPKFNKDIVVSSVKNQKVVISYPAQFNPQDLVVQSVAQKAVLKALRAEAEAYLPGRLESLSQSSSLNYQDLKLRNMKRKWGSCNQNTVITLNIWLMSLPDNLIDYVLLHELTHTKYMNHQADFWNELSKLCPDYKTLRSSLKQAKTLLGEEASSM